MSSTSTSETRLHSSSPSSSSKPEIMEISVPDCTPERSYLDDVSKFVYTECVDDESAEGHLEIVKVDWKGVALNFLYKEIVRQFYLGLVYATGCQIITEVFSLVGRGSSLLYQVGIRRLPFPKFGEFTTRMRDFANSFAGGAKANIAPAK